MRVLAIPAVLALTAAWCFSRDVPRGVEHGATALDDAKAGLWAIPALQRHDPARLLCGAPDPFYFDGETLTLRLIRMHAWEWESPDGYYRVKTKWVGDNLYWLPPFGRWEKHATFRGGRFEVEVGTFTWRYERVSRTQVPEELRPFVKRREKHDYSICPDGSRDPERLKGLE
jgi:hypothetical protein